jgi:hypothetical protein
MAFNEEEFLKKYSSKSPSASTSFDVENFAKKYSVGSPRNLETSSGLTSLAEKSGLENKVNKIMSTKGEDVNEIFSGGFISDVFDALNTLQYGVVGIIKGKGFAEGVKTKQSFADEDALGKKGILGSIAGIALDIVCDPLTYVSPLTILKKIPGVAKVASAAKTKVFGKMTSKAIAGTTKFAESIEGGTDIGKYLAEKFIWMFGKDPVYKASWIKSTKNILVQNQLVADIAKKVIALPDDVAKKILTIDKTGRVARVGINTLKKILKKDEFDVVSQAWKMIDSLGDEAVKAGLLSKKTFEENFGEYIKNAYLEYETKKGGSWGALKKTVSKQFSRKKSLTPEQMTKLGQIDNAGYLMAKGSMKLIKDIENVKFFNKVNDNFGSKIYGEGLKQIPKGINYGKLAGKFVPENIYDDITEIMKTGTRGVGEEIIGEFKKFKTIMNPATHVRNVISNTILNWWKLGIGPWNVQKYVNAANDIKKGTPIWKRAQKVGAGLDTFAANEIKESISNPKNYEGALGKLRKVYDDLGNKLGNLYQNEESVAKMVAFKEGIKKGLTDEKAWQMAESATFNYAQVTPFVRKLRTAIWGYPFITFTSKATPVAVETALKAPQRISVFGKIKNAIEEQSDIDETQRERASEPSWIRDGFYIKLPIKDEHGRSAYFDLTYIIPFGDLVSGQIFTRQVDKDTGLPESVPETLTQGSPLINLIKELSKNQDFYGDRIWKESDSVDKQLGDIMRHLTKTILPPLVSDQIPGGYQHDNTRRQKGVLETLGKEEDIKQQRTTMQEMLRNVGIKIQPIDVDIQETYMEWEKKKALETLLKEEGTLKEYNRHYIPK